MNREIHRRDERQGVLLCDQPILPQARAFFQIPEIDPPERSILDDELPLHPHMSDVLAAAA
jgi:hypothetical protein